MPIIRFLLLKANILVCTQH